MLDNWFTYHVPSGEVDGKPGLSKLSACLRIREAGKYFAQIIIDCTPSSADQTAVVRLIRQAVMIANQGIDCGGK